MTPEEFSAKFGCTPDEYAERVRTRLTAALGRKAHEENSAVLAARIDDLRLTLEKHFHEFVKEGVVTDWSLTISKNGDCKLKIVSVGEFAEMFRRKGFEVEESK
jgi:hypothetical protein